MSIAPNRTFRAAILMIGATTAFSAGDVLAKVLPPDFGVLQITWARYAFFLPLVLLIALPWRWPALLRGPRRALQLGRGMIPVVGGIGMVAAVRMMPLADATALVFAAPLIVAALSGWLLGERVGPYRWAAVAIGFAGVLIIVRPGSGVLGVTALVPLFVACLLALFQITSRILGRAADPAATVLYTALVGTVVMSFAVPFAWRPPTPAEWAILVASGVLHGAAHIFTIRAFTLAEAATLTPFSYTQLVAAIAFGLIVFGQLPDPATSIGILVIAGSGLLIYVRERQRRRQTLPDRTGDRRDEAVP